MKINNPKRANETADHVSKKAAIILHLLLDPAIIVLPELGLCDVVAGLYIGGRFCVIGLEYERTPVNSIRNILRNYDNGFDYTVSISSDSKVMGNIAASVTALPENVRRKVLIMTFDSFMKSELSLLINNTNKEV